MWDFEVRIQNPHSTQSALNRAPSKVTIRKVLTQTAMCGPPAPVKHKETCNSMWWWRQVRRADIPRQERDVFERYGETVLQLILTSGFQSRVAELHDVYNNAESQKHAIDW